MIHPEGAGWYSLYTVHCYVCRLKSRVKIQFFNEFLNFHLFQYNLYMFIRNIRVVAYHRLVIYGMMNVLIASLRV